MNILIALNYQREIPPFMQIELKYAQEVFDFIYYISPSVSNGEVISKKCKKTMLVEVSRKKKALAALLACIGMFSNEYLSAFNKARKNKKLNKGLIKYIFKHRFCEIMLSKAVYRIIEKHSEKDNICVISAWFNETAYILAKAKKRYTGIKAYSFAHAFEIDPNRNPYINDAFDDYKFAYLDKVYFISNLMRQRYLDFVSPSIKELVRGKSDITYLGCVKLYPSEEVATDGIFNICSCSSIVDVKRLTLIVHALSAWNFGKICWTHLGDGSLRTELEKEITVLQTQNPNVKVRIMGKLTNDEVHQYYASHRVDLFLNVSEREGLPVSIMEAMAYGICVMATDVGGTSEIVNKTNGILLPCSIAADQLCDGLQQFLELSNEQKIILRRNAQSTWRQKFNAAENVKRFLEKLK